MHSAASRALTREVPGALGSRSGPSSASESGWSAAVGAAGKGGVWADDGSRERALQVHVCGRIESGQLERAEQVSCSYEFVVGPDWQPRGGHESGETQPANNQALAVDKPSVVWNFPVEVSFVSTNVSGWPRLSVTVRNADRTIVGYGSVHVPTSQRSCVRYCRIFKPLSSSVIGDAISSLGADRPEFYDARFTTACVGREAARVVSSGVVKIVFHTRLVGAEALGYTM